MSRTKSPDAAQLPLESTRRARPSTCCGGAAKDRRAQAEVAHDGRVEERGCGCGPAPRAQRDAGCCSHPTHEERA